MLAVPEGLKRVRRIVTGTNAEGRSIIASDGDAPNVFAPAGSKVVAQVVWATGEAAAEGADPAPVGHHFGFHSEKGSILRIADFPPDETMDTEALGHFLDESGVRDGSENRHFWFHKTHSLDYAIVLEGEIYAMMDEGETLMQQGDVLVQRATSHSWSNRSGRNCRMAFILLALEGRRGE
ncbi:cupin domain-containing protein [Rhizorhabdus wittichii]|uniref:Cupin domain-containing protein n=1 Tax=Rhizorhabdus wittichii (strain DSM 6014 / CCUG 31198 / JCM 15750 / NBRC 105917 / EY 4224 / RW1) TaxID=392499 RepID=A0A9J9HA90_RHIWR|nr:cupin domain-containing protein [Rhizorhabdus wittichii]ABQ67918.1 hypothetical protein Swit_1555 [Rhizorhabdus wittichii RW1]